MLSSHYSFLLTFKIYTFISWKFKSVLTYDFYFNVLFLES